MICWGSVEVALASVLTVDGPALESTQVCYHFWSALCKNFKSVQKQETCTGNKYKNRENYFLRYDFIHTKYMELT